MANIAQSVNVISPLMTTKDGIYKQTTWWPLLLFSKYMHGSTIAAHAKCSRYEGETEPKWLQGTVETPWLDVSATMDNEGMVSMVVVNAHLEKKFEAPVHGLDAIDGKVEVYILKAERWDSRNTARDSPVKITEDRWDGKGKMIFDAFTMTMLRWKT